MAARIRFSAAVVGLTMGLLTPLLAHHDVGVAYDVCRTVTLDGVVTGLEWRHPHVVLHLNVIGKDRKTLAWAVLTPAPNALNRQGLNDFFTKTGDHVTAHVFVAKDGSHEAITQDLILPDGRTISAVMSVSSLREAQARCPSHSPQ
jgi:Family of unknown function (DUF6152)